MKRGLKLIIMAVVLGLLLGAYFIAKRISEKHDGEDTPAETESYGVTALEAEKLTSLRVRRTENGEDGASVTELSFRLSDDKTKWLWSEDESVPLDNVAFANIVTALNESSSPVKMTDVTDEELKTYGLDNPHIVVTFGFSDGSGYTAKVGKYNSFNSLYYYSDSNDSAVYMVSEAVNDSLSVGIFDVLLYDTLPELTSSNITSLTYEKGDRKLVYKYYPGGNPADYTDAYNWYVSVNGAKETAVAKNIASDLTDALVNRKLLDAVAYNKSKDAEFGMDAPGKLVIAYQKTEKIEDSQTGSSSEITTPAEYTLYFGSQDEDAYYYVRTQDSDLIYTLTLSDTFYDILEEDGRRILPDELGSFNDTFIDRVVFKAGEKTVDVKLTHADGTTAYTLASGETADLEKYTELMAKLGTGATSYTSVLEADPSVGTDIIASAEFTFNSGDVKSAVLEIRRYSGSYARVSFMGRDDQLITADEAEAIASLIAAF